MAIGRRPVHSRPSRTGPRGVARLVRLARPAAVAALALVLAGCSVAFPADGATAQGRDVRGLYDIVLVPVAIIFVLVEGLIVWSVLRYRRRDDSFPEQVHGNNALELTWTILPTLLVLGVFVLSMQTLAKVDAKAANPDVTVDVHAYQWYWDFDYPNEGVKVSGLGTQPELVLPVGRAIHLNLRSDNVIHSMYVPHFLFKRDVIPGVENSFDFTIEEAGTYRGQCAEFCGVGHADMAFSIRGVSDDEFAAWVSGQSGGASAPPASAAPGASTLEVSASTTTSFEQAALDAPANAAFSIHFVNKEAATPHDVAIRDASGSNVFIGDIVTGPGEKTYTVPSLSPGAYTFFCAVHPQMQGVLTVR